jgi:hypothetical protein
MNDIEKEEIHKKRENKMKFKVRYGLGGGFGGLDTGDEEIVEASNLEEATILAWDFACEYYDQYGGILRSIEDIVEEEEVSLSEAEEIWNDERESWLEYEAIPIEDDIWGINELINL